MMPDTEAPPAEVDPPPAEPYYCDHCHAVIGHQVAIGDRYIWLYKIDGDRLLGHGEAHCKYCGGYTPWRFIAKKKKYHG
jgi:hypothetical protein